MRVGGADLATSGEIKDGFGPGVHCPIEESFGQQEDAASSKNYLSIFNPSSLHASCRSRSSGRTAIGA